MSRFCLCQYVDVVKNDAMIVALGRFLLHVRRALRIGDEHGVRLRMRGLRGASAPSSFRERARAYRKICKGQFFAVFRVFFCCCGGVLLRRRGEQQKQ